VATGTSIDHKIKAQKSRRAHKPVSESEESVDEDIEDDGEEESDGDDLLPGEEPESGSEEEVEEDDADEEEERNASSDSEDGDEDNVQLQPAPNSKEAALKKDEESKKAARFFDSTPKNTKFSASNFGDLNLSRPLIRACAALGYSKPTPIQAACIPLALTGRDICGSAITGSGKTAAFTLPLLERLLHRDKRITATYVLILVPARELAVQVHSMIERLAQFTDIRAALVVGGLSLSAQAAALRTGPEIVVGTPGRVIDHLRNSQGFGLEDLAALVLDEADRLLEMGFKDEIHEIVKLAPLKRQTLLFSATMTDQVKDLINLSLHHPVRLAADESAAAPKALTQEVLRLKGKASMKKEATLLALVARSFKDSGRVIIFFSTKQKAHRAKILFGLADLPLAVELHGDMTQAARLQSLEDFRTGKAGFLLATDVAARGLDILGVETVINFDAPRTLTSYLHRVGRTARAGTSGRSITFIEDSDRLLLKEIIKKGKIDLLSRKVAPVAINSWQSKLEGFERDVIQILKAEREEKELRKAEMEAQKASNMIDHRDEIYARPARTWFQTKSQKMSIAGEARKAALGLLQEQENEQQKPESKAAAKSQKRLEKKKAVKEAEEREKKLGRSKALVEETKEVANRVRLLKAKEQELRESGLSAAQAGRIAAASLSTGTKKKKRKRELFSDGSENKGTVGESKVYAGGAKTRGSTGKTASADNRLFGQALNKVKRGGKGKKSFKSKAKHKRR
jgi:ATP-dependent RNA helicase DDX27